MTVANFETVAELKDLVAAKDYTISQLGKARDAFQWGDPAAASDWDSDFTALKVRYALARAMADAAFGRAALMLTTPNALIPAPLEWDAIIKAIRQNPDTQTKGDLQDLSDRLNAAGQKVDYSNTPQPKKGQDADLNVYKQADTVIKKGEDAAKKGTKKALPWVLGALGA